LAVQIVMKPLRDVYHGRAFKSGELDFKPWGNKT
jgi:hypothetical protein